MVGPERWQALEKSSSGLLVGAAFEVACIIAGMAALGVGAMTFGRGRGFATGSDTRPGGSRALSESSALGLVTPAPRGVSKAFRGGAWLRPPSGRPGSSADSPGGPSGRPEVAERCFNGGLGARFNG